MRKSFLIGKQIEATAGNLRNSGFKIAFGIFTCFCLNATWSLADGSREANVAVPPPPVKIVDLAKIEPSHDVSARVYNPPYCLKWNDGCVKCVKKDVNSKRECTVINHNIDQCIRTFSICNVTDNSISNVCNELKFVQFERHNVDPDNHNFETFVHENLYGSGEIGWQYNSGRWQVAGGSEFIQNPRLNHSVIYERGYICILTFSNAYVRQLIKFAK